uniref:Ig-like domain-containing protein n=1 Tax=Cyprinus carpio TaxID=7962 RepID=A0A8C2FEK3_CYPCA
MAAIVRQNTHHTPAYWWRGDRVMKPISVWGWLGGHDDQRPMGEFGQDAEVTPLLFLKDILGFLMTTENMHTHQLVYGCEWNDETGKTNGFRKFAIDGEVFLYLDLKRMEWISPMQLGFNIQQKCNNKTISLAYWKDYLENECIENLKKFLQLGESSLEKTVSPQVSLLQRNASSPVLCHVTDFYPSNVTITWMKNGQEHYKDVKAGKLLPNEDGTFQKTVALKTEPDEWRRNEFSCVVEHQSRTIRKTLTEKEIRTNDEPSAPVGVTVAVVSVGILLLITAVIGYLLYQKKRKTASDSGSDSSSQTAAQA